MKAGGIKLSREFIITGATTVGIVCKDGVVLASEKRVSYGFTVLSKAGKKVYPITDYLGVAFAGLVSDMLAIVRTLAAEAKLYELDHGRKMPVNAASKLLANILFSSRYYPLLTETIIGGVDDKGPRLYVLDAVGSLIEDKYAALGTGAQVAIGIVESNYKEDMDVEAGKELAIKAVRAAIERDAVSGDGIDVLTITAQGTKEYFIPIR